uniref:Pseudouridine synthase RsuA/RluA-like domain-containing protein n=1 Tax=Noctiluca scintillans TaxID=2966 RepID=A0A7S1F138_NOCSC
MLCNSATGVKKVVPKTAPVPDTPRAPARQAAVPGLKTSSGVLSFKSVKPVFGAEAKAPKAKAWVRPPVQEEWEEQDEQEEWEEPAQQAPSLKRPVGGAPPTPLFTAPAKPQTQEEVEWVNYDMEDTTVWNQYDDAPDGNVAVEEAENGWYGEVAEPVSKRQKVTPTPRPPSLPPPGMSRDTSSNDENEKAMLAAEHEEWAQRCAIDPARPGQPLRLTILMAEAGLGDADLATWCEWMDRRFAAECPNASAMSSRTRFKASSIDFSENTIGTAGIKALCALLEKHRVRCDILRLTGNCITNDGSRSVLKYLASSSQAAALEVHLSRNKITAEGLKWVLGNLAMHPAYPVWNNDAQRFAPLRLNIENSTAKAQPTFQSIEAACKQFGCTVALGETGSSDMYKTNCAVHLRKWELPAGGMVPSAELHTRPIFAQAGRAAPKPPPSGVTDPVREEPRVVYEDDDLAVILKPAGWSCAPNPADVNPTWSKMKPLARRMQVGELLQQAAAAPLQGWLLLQFGADPNCEVSRDRTMDRGLAHRLDVDTSGPVLVGKTLKGYEHARKQIVAGVLKDYVALVHGTFNTERGECCAPVDSSAFAETMCVKVGEAGQPATTVWEAVAEYESPDRSEKYTLVHCRMVTLRTHQIRAHFQHLGHPLVGDEIYGTGEVPDWCPRIFSHKFRIGFFNAKNQACVETCSLQSVPDLWKALGSLRKVGGMAMMGCGAPGL